METGRTRSRVTLKDVAQLAGCSTAVVSTIVNNAKGNTLVSAETRKRVLMAAKSLNYRPDFASRSLVQRKTRTLGIYIPPSPWAGVGFAYEGAILRGIEAQALAKGYDLLLLNVSGNQGVEACIRKFGEGRIDGLLLMHVEPDARWLGELLNASVNVVAVDYSGNESRLDTVGFDNIAAGKMAVEHLKSLGHKKIGFAGSCRRPASVDASLRLDGFIEAMGQNGLVVKPGWIFDSRMLATALKPEDPVCQMEGRLVAQYIVSLGSDGPTAWFFYSDLVAVHAMRHLHAAGIKVPGQLSLVGVDDSEWSRFVSPSLTSIRHPLEEMGQRAAEMLIKKSEGGSQLSGGVGERVLFAPQVVARESSAAPAGGMK